MGHFFVRSGFWLGAAASFGGVAISVPIRLPLVFRERQQYTAVAAHAVVDRTIKKNKKNPSKISFVNTKHTNTNISRFACHVTY